MQQIPRTVVAQQATWLCTAGDCGGLYSTAQEHCVCGALLMSTDDLLSRSCRLSEMEARLVPFLREVYEMRRSCSLAASNSVVIAVGHMFQTHPSLAGPCSACGLPCKCADRIAREPK